MATTGWVDAGTGAQDTSYGAINWVLPSRIIAEDGVAAYTGSGIGSTYYLKGTNFGFSLASNAVIDGIRVRLKAYQATGTGNNEKISRVRIVKGGTIGTTDLGDDQILHNTQFTWYTYGSASEKWGETWTAADVNSSDFGFVVSIYQQITFGRADVDAFQIEISYHTPYEESITSSMSLGQTTSAIKTMNEAHAGAAVAGYTINVTLDQYPAVTNALTGLGFSIIDDVGFVEDISAAVTPTMSIADVITFGTTLNAPVVVECSIGDEFGKYRTVFLPRDVTWKNVRNNE